MRTIVRAYLLGWMLLASSTAVLSQKVVKTISNAIPPECLAILHAAGSQANFVDDQQLIPFCHEVNEKGNPAPQASCAADNSLMYLLPANTRIRCMTVAQILSFFILSRQQVYTYGYLPFFSVKELNTYAEAFLQIHSRTIDVTNLSWGRAVRRVPGGTSKYDDIYSAGIVGLVPVRGTLKTVDIGWDG